MRALNKPSKKTTNLATFGWRRSMYLCLFLDLVVYTGYMFINRWQFKLKRSWLTNKGEKSLKKIFKLFLCIAIFLTLSAPFSSSASVILFDDFEDGSLSQWDIWPGFSPLEVTDELAKDGSWSVHSVSDIGAIKKEFSPISSGRLIISWQANELVRENNSLMYVSVGEIFNDRLKNELLVNIGLGRIYASYLKNGVWNSYQIASNTSTNKWYQLSIEHDFELSITKFLIDGVVVEEINSQIPSISYVWIGDAVSCSGMGNCSIESVADKIFVDNISIVLKESNSLPLANAGQDQSVHPGDSATLDGSASSDPDENYPLAYSWEIIAKPEGSTAILSDPNTASPTLLTDEPGDYEVKLVVTDSEGLASTADTVLVSTYNTPPVADAGEDAAIIALGTTVILSGEQSYDPEGDPLEYTWALISKPPESEAYLNAPNSPTPSFMADVQGQYIVELVVADPWVLSEPDTVTVSFTNIKPVADAGDNLADIQGESVELDGRNSHDANGDPLAYSWSLASKPEGSLAGISNASSAIASLGLDLPGEYIVSLMVNDGFIDSDPSNITVMVISKQDATTLALQDVLVAINDLEKSVFINKNLQKPMTNKINTVLKLVDQGEHYESLEKLNNDVLRKVDGCAESGEPDKNDWIKDCAAQEAVSLPLQEAINLLWDM